MEDGVAMETVDATLIKNGNEKVTFTKNTKAINNDEADAKETTSQTEEDGVSCRKRFVYKHHFQYKNLNK